MATMEPTEHEISQVIDFACLNHLDDRGMVIQALKVRCVSVRMSGFWESS